VIIVDKEVPTSSLKKNVISVVKDLKEVNFRLTIQKFFKIAFVSALAPSEEKSNEEKEKFYSLLESTLE
jgi:hypothetical protein